MTPEERAEQVSEDWYSMAPKYRTQEKLEELIAREIRRALDAEVEY